MTEKNPPPPDISGFPAPLYEFFFRERGDRVLALYFRRNGASIEDAEDLVQEVILKSVRHFSTYRGSGNIKSWILAIARNQLIDSLRSKSYRNEISDSTEEVADLIDKLYIDQSEEDRALMRERQNHVSQAFARFSKDKPEVARALHMFLNEDMTFQEIAGVLGRTERATREYISHAMKQFRQYLKEALNVE